MTESASYSISRAYGAPDTLNLMWINQLIIQALKAEASEAEVRELEAWRKASPANDRHYREFVALWRLTEPGDEVEIARLPNVADIVGKDAVSRPEVVRFPPGAHADRDAGGRRGWQRYWPHLAAVAAGLSILAAGTRVATMIQPGSRAPRLAVGTDELVTGTSEMATVSLRDGSVVRLAPNSRLVLSGTTEEREVALKGRAFFAIAPDDERPFQVHADAGTVTVLGTRFDLESEGENLRVVVVEGRVSIATGGRQLEVGAGEMGRVLDGTPTPTARIPSIDSLLDWVGNFLAFQATPLAQAALEIEREYGVRVDITDTALAERTVTGWFADKALDEVLRIVCAVVAAQCKTDGGVVTISPSAHGVDAGPAPPRRL